VQSAAMDVKQWISWALSANIDQSVIGYISSFNDNLYYGQAVPRTWEMISDILKTVPLDSDILYHLLIGTIGPEVGNLFFSYLKTTNQLPSFQEIESDPLNCKIPQDTGLIYALSASILYSVNTSNFNSVFQYINRMPQEVIHFVVNQIIEKKPDICSLPDFINWQNANKDLYF